MISTAEIPPADLASLPHTRRTLGLTALTGLMLFVVSLGTFTPESSPAPGDATAAEIRRFAADNAGTLKLNLVTGLIGIALFAVFVAALAQLARNRRPRTIVPGVLLLCGAVSMVELALNTAVRSIFVFPHEIASVSDSTVVAWYDLSGVEEWFASMVTAGPRMVLIVAFSVFALRTRLMARWVCWSGLAVAAFGLISFGDVFFPLPS